MDRTLPVRVPAAVTGTALGLAFVVAAGFLGWELPAWREPGFLHAPYLAVAPLALATLVLILGRPTRRTCLWAALAGVLVALTAKGSAWSVGRVLAFLGGGAILVGSLLGYVYGPAFDLRRVPLVRPSPPADGWLAGSGVLVAAGVAALTTLPSADGLVDTLAVVVLVGTGLLAGVALVLYRWGPDLRVAALGLPVVVPSLVLAAPLARLVDPLAGFLVALAAVGLTCAFGVGLVYTHSGSIARSLVGAPVRVRREQGRPFSHLATLPVVTVTAGLLAVLIGGLLPWHARVLRLGGPSPLPEAGAGVPGYYVVLGVATAALLASVVRWTDSAMRLLGGLGLLLAVLATGENPVDGGRLAATVGAALVVTGALLADRDGRDVSLGALGPRRPRAPLAAWFALLGWLLAVAPLAVSRPVFGPSPSLVTDPFVRRGATGVFVVFVSAVDVTATGTVLVLLATGVTGGVVCLFRWHPETGLALGLAGLVVVGWTLVLLLLSSSLTAEGVLVVRLVGVGGLALFTAGALSVLDVTGGDESDRDRSSPP
jgi:hypothetical protein